MSYVEYIIILTIIFCITNKLRLCGKSEHCCRIQHSQTNEDIYKRIVQANYTFSVNILSNMINNTYNLCDIILNIIMQCDQPVLFYYYI